MCFTLTFLASAFLLETFFGFAAVVAFFAVEVFLEETLGVATFLTAGFGVAFALGFLEAITFLGFSTVSLEAVFVPSAAFFVTLAVVLFCLSLAEDGFLVVVTLFLEEAGFLF